MLQLYLSKINCEFIECLYFLDAMVIDDAALANLFAIDLSANFWRLRSSVSEIEKINPIGQQSQMIY